MVEATRPSETNNQHAQKRNQDAEAAIGEQLRSQRKAHGISLVEVAEHTKIGKRYLEALEEGHFDVVPCETYIRGFLRAYAKYLEMDDEQLINQYTGTKHYEQCEEAEASDPEEEVRKTNQNVWLPMIAILILAGMGAGLFLLWPTGTPEKSVAGEGLLAVAEPQGIENPMPARVPGPHEPLSLKIRGKEKTWVTLMIDGRQEPDITLNPGQERSWQAQERFVLWTGNAGGIEVHFNGELQPPLGEVGQVRKEVIFERQAPVLEPALDYQ